MKTKTQTAWVVEWEFFRRITRFSDYKFHPYFLPYRWNSPRVFEFMKCVFWNSDFQTPLGALVGIKKASPEGVLKREEMKRLIYGETTHFLVAAKANDIRFTLLKQGEMKAEWTRPAGTDIDIDTLQVSSVGNPVKREFVWKQSISIGN